MPFDRAHPLPSNTLQNIRATGVGQASLGRLWFAVWLGVATAVALAGSRAWWLAFWPTCVASLGAYGVAAKEGHRLDITHHPSRSRRAWLQVARGASLGVLAACAIAGSVLLTGVLVRADWVLDLIE